MTEPSSSDAPRPGPSSGPLPASDDTVVPADGSPAEPGPVAAGSVQVAGSDHEPDGDRAPDGDRDDHDADDHDRDDRGDRDRDRGDGDRDGDRAAALPQDPAGTAPPHSRRFAALLPLAALGLVVLLLAALVAVLAVKDRDASRVAALRRQDGPALTAAREAGRLLFSYDYRKLDADFTAARGLTTGDFTKEYQDFTDKVVTPVAKENEVVVAATVGQAGTTGATTPDQVVALVFVDQVTTSKVAQDEAVDRSRVRMTLVERDGRWLVSKVEAL